MVSQGEEFQEAEPLGVEHQVEISQGVKYQEGGLLTAVQLVGKKDRFQLVVAEWKVGDSTIHNNWDMLVCSHGKELVEEFQ